LICFGCSWAYATPPKTPCAIKNGASLYLAMLYTQRGDPRMVCRCQYARPRPTEKQEGLHIVEDVTDSAQELLSAIMRSFRMAHDETRGRDGL